MKVFVPSVLAAALLLPSQAAAQFPDVSKAAQAVQEEVPPARLDISVLAGRFASTDWSDTVVLGTIGPGGVIEQLIVRDLGVEPSNGLEVTASYWRGRYGFRAHGSWTRTCVAARASCADADAVDLDSWLFDVGGAIGLREYDRDHVVRPFVFFGIGAAAYNLERRIGPEFLTLVAEGPARPGQPIVIRDEDSTEFILSVDGLGLETSLAATAGFGTDVRAPLSWGGIGLRLELADHVSRSPVDLRVTRLSDGGLFGGIPQTRIDFGAVHHFRATAGIVVDFAVD